MRTKSLFLPGGPFCHHIRWRGATQGPLGCRSSLCDSPFLLRSGLRPCTRKWMLPRVVLAWEAFQKTALLHPEQHRRKRGNQTKVLVVRNWKSTWDAIRSTPVRLHSTSVAELGGASGPPALARGRLSLSGEGQLQWKVRLQPRLEQGGMPLWKEATLVDAVFSPLTDGSWQFQNHSFQMYFKNWNV